MSARIVQVAQAVKSLIDSATLPMSVVTAVAWVPMTDRASMPAPTVWIVPTAEASTTLGRGVRQRDCEIVVGLQKAIDDDAEADSLVALLEAIGDELFQKPLPGGVGAFLAMRTEPLLDAEHWSTLRQYTGLLRLTYRVFA